MAKMKFVPASLGVALLLGGCSTVEGALKPFPDDVLARDKGLAHQLPNQQERRVEAPKENKKPGLFHHEKKAAPVELSRPAPAISYQAPQPQPQPAPEQIAAQYTPPPAPMPIQKPAPVVNSAQVQPNIQYQPNVQYLQEAPPKEKHKFSLGLPKISMPKVSMPKIRLPKLEKREETSNSAPIISYAPPSYNAPAPAKYSNQTTYAAPQNYSNEGYVYRLGSGDKIRVIVFDEPTLSGEFFVNGEGKVSMPLIGEVRAGGLTVSQLQTAITRALANGYLRRPQVSAEVLNFRPFYILGEVQKPGMYPYSDGLIVDNAVALGGGYTYRADKRKYYIKHESSSSEQEVPAGGAILVQPGDTIRISERYF